ncbi:DNA topoisomerase-3 [Verrucomicrobium sp. GAS474]|uniref:DNA topoisomerase III n=1 Tax=Verrucomicrobium sp. GAS474 TaxID=1882831 RepID=UPI00087BFB93|nr:DNA topoisomerase III [Verrucomicrobium sp. GAS474]SDU21165.1 DNA topoisomerase-3 [Verrucomicrobium sp. GAS474]
MGKGLIIAEKPSVANDIAKALGKFTKKDEYLENDEWVISSAVGHLLELCLPVDIQKKHRSWKFESLPILPDHFDLKPIEKSKSRLVVLKKLLARPDVDHLVNACDAGREGELIFRYIIQHCKSKKPTQRLWLQSMTQDAIRQGFEKLRPGKDLDPLAQAAVSRSESDWLIGINGTRALTALNSKDGGFILTTVGRVQTPTLALIVERDLKIRDFKSRAYWEIHAAFGAKAGTYDGRWFDENFKKSDKEEDEGARPERVWDQAKAEAIHAKCEGKPGVVTEERKPSSQASPGLFDLTTLQREANGRFGLSAKRTLQIAQALYEKHKVLTYPRTDSRHLPEDYLSNVQATLKGMDSPSLAPFARQALKEGWVKPTKKVFDNTKISDHFAIIPTGTSPDKLDDFEFKVYELVAKRFIAVFFPPAQFETLTRITRVEGEAFKTENKVLVVPGWLSIYGRQPNTADDDSQIAPVEAGETVKTEVVEVRAFDTKPPAHFTEATLLSAMEGAGKLVEDEHLREAMGKKGLGTPATRASIIEGLLAEKYLQREARDLLAMPKAFALIEMLRATGMPVLTSPEMTGEWEFKLQQMEQGAIKRDDFMKEIVDLTTKIVDKAKGFEETETHAKPYAGKGPNGEAMVETMRYYQTPDGSFKLSKYIAGRMLEPHEAAELIEKKFIGPLQGFRSKMGRPFVAALKFNAENKVEFVFEDSAATAGTEAVDVETAIPVGPCPVDGARVFEGTLSFICEHGLIDPPTCKFRIGKKILGKDITREQAEKILNQKKSDLLPGFMSQRTKRPFSAYLVIKPDESKVSFEFEPRGPKAPKPPGATKGKKPVGAGKAGFVRRAVTPKKSDAGAESSES